MEQHRELYNAALQERRGAYQHSRSYVSFMQQSKELTDIRNDHPEWKAQNRRLAVETLKRLDKAYQRFYANLKADVHVSRAGQPRFKPAHRFHTLEIYAGADQYLRADRPGRYRLQIKGCPAIRFRTERQLPEGQPKTIRVVRKERRVEVQLVYMVDVPEPIEATGEGVGLDMGISAQVTDDTGRKWPKRAIDRRRLNRVQRRMARLRKCADESNRARWAMKTYKSGVPALGKDGKPKFFLEWTNGKPSHRYIGIRRQFAREWERVSETERNGAHRMTTYIINQLNPGDVVSVEDLRIQNMVKNHHLARSIHEQGWGRVVRQLEYKAARAGLRFVKVNPANTSQDCSGCGERVPKTLKERVHDCPHCGLVLDRDENAGANILRRAVYDGTAGANSGRKASPGGAQDVYQPPGLPGVAAEIRPEH